MKGLGVRGNVDLYRLAHHTHDQGAFTVVWQMVPGGFHCFERDRLHIIAGIPVALVSPPPVGFPGALYLLGVVHFMHSFVFIKMGSIIFLVYEGGVRLLVWRAVCQFGMYVRDRTNAV